MAVYHLICEICSKTFTSDKRTAKYCSKECLGKGLSEKKTIFGEEEAKQIVELRKEGKTCEEIAEELGCCVAVVRQITNKFDIKMTREEVSDLMKKRWEKKERIDADGMIECVCCKERKHKDLFFDSPRNALGKRTSCKECMIKEKNDKKAEQKLAFELVEFASKKLGITKDQLKEMYLSSKPS